MNIPRTSSHQELLQQFCLIYRRVLLQVTVSLQRDVVPGAWEMSWLVESLFSKPEELSLSPESMGKRKRKKLSMVEPVCDPNNEEQRQVDPWGSRAT